MVKGMFLRSAALAAIVGAMTLAVPAQAQDRDRSEARAEQRQMRQEMRQEAGEQRAARAAQRPQQAQVQQAPQARQEWRQQRQAAQGAPDRQGQRAARQEWRQQNQGAQAAPDRQAQRAARQDWRQQRTAQPQVQVSPDDPRLQRYREGSERDRAYTRMQQQAQARQSAEGRRDWRGRDGSTVQGERNRSYTDRDRNRTYRDGYRDGRTADSYRDNRDQRQAYRDGYRNGNRNDWRDNNWRGDRNWRGGNDRRWDNNWRRDNRYNWYSYRNQHRDIYRVGRYYSPYRNYSYSRLSIGFFLDSGFYGNRYWVNDPWQYRLPEVYGPYKWVRYYDDVILVDIYTGEVVDVIHDFFW